MSGFVIPARTRARLAGGLASLCVAGALFAGITTGSGRNAALASTPEASPTATEIPLAPLPSLNHLLFLTPPATETPVVPTETPSPQPTPQPSPTAAPDEGLARSPVRAVIEEGPEETKEPEPTETPSAAETPTPEPTSTVAATITPVVPLPTAPTGRAASTIPSTPPPLDLTPAGIAGGGPAQEKNLLPSGTLMTAGIAVLAAGASWGFYFFLKPPTD